ncbi:DUF1513 domain-containing protein [Bordetella hinzii]|uniref:DUF1513 domain-containing protein n=1 Tax=Bordetella hinzii TaxID=103855 RepID=A0AAN1VI68_9BORD|nr:DUF1513 domain-containing protein [Bordetella hinzii]AKQ59065.1 hypothetical protein ACR55_01172 [Bordetella hinzii]AZW19407.1 DUF1513 domain-containing protein [Bordetella hinzii]KCB47403.1 PF07433 family protein [Bordetella hinzii 4161]KXA72952.1 Tat pathway signal protein [Bordetella hinzii LMG 13501]MBZ0077427.1 DUF1513 domain-containing protein [Bordetella hinzii]
MAIDRRGFLALGASALMLPGRLIAAPDGQARYVTARRRAARHEVVVLDARGHDLLVLPMPGRGHSFAIEGEQATVFGRQPGFFALSFDLRGRRPPQLIEAAQGRHFFGHGVYLPGGQLMLATENDYEAGQGVIGVYDVSGRPRRVGEFASGGIGPHEAILMPDGKTLCVANGGILTHPDYGKLELNLDTMRPSLAYLDAASGQLLEKVELDPRWHRLSIRHLALAADGAVWFGCQHMGPAHERPALVGRHRRGGAPECFAGDPERLRGMRNYVGSVAADASGSIIATSSPVGGQVLYWDAASGRQLGATALADGCGVAPAPGGGFLVSSGLGAMLRAGPAGIAASLMPAGREQSWDNHFRRAARLG